MAEGDALKSFFNVFDQCSDVFEEFCTKALEHNKWLDEVVEQARHELWSSPADTTIAPVSAGPSAVNDDADADATSSSSSAVGVDTTLTAGGGGGGCLLRTPSVRRQRRRLESQVAQRRQADAVNCSLLLESAGSMRSTRAAAKVASLRNRQNVTISLTRKLRRPSRSAILQQQQMEAALVASAASTTTATVGSDAAAAEQDDQADQVFVRPLPPAAPDRPHVGVDVDGSDDTSDDDRPAAVRRLTRRGGAAGASAAPAAAVAVGVGVKPSAARASRAQRVQQCVAPPAPPRPLCVPDARRSSTSPRARSQSPSSSSSRKRFAEPSDLCSVSSSSDSDDNSERTCSPRHTLQPPPSPPPSSTTHHMPSPTAQPAVSANTDDQIAGTSKESVTKAAKRLIEPHSPSADRGRRSSSKRYRSQSLPKSQRSSDDGSQNAGRRYSTRRTLVAGGDCDTAAAAENTADEVAGVSFSSQSDADTLTTPPATSVKLKPPSAQDAVAGSAGDQQSSGRRTRSQTSLSSTASSSVSSASLQVVAPSSVSDGCGGAGAVDKSDHGDSGGCGGGAGGSRLVTPARAQPRRQAARAQHDDSWEDVRSVPRASRSAQCARVRSTAAATSRGALVRSSSTVRTRTASALKPHKQATNIVAGASEGFSFISKAAPAKPSAEQMEQRRRDELLRKREREQEAVKKRDELIRQRAEADKLKREQRQRHALELRQRKEQEQRVAQQRRRDETERRQREADDKRRLEQQQAEAAKRQRRLEEAEQAAARRKQEELEQRRKQEELEQKRKQEELEQRRKQEELEQKRKQEELEQKRKQEELEQRRKQEELEQRRRQDDVERKKLEAAQRKKQAELEQKRQRLEAVRAAQEASRLHQQQKAANTRQPPLRLIPQNAIKIEPMTTPKPNLNTTFTRDETVGGGGGVISAPQTTTSTTTAATSSYDMTPRFEEVSPAPLANPDDYNINDLRSDDDTDDETRPRKQIPKWAQGASLRTALMSQDCSRANYEAIFPPSDLFLPVKLEVLFTVARRCFYKRTSSACWDTPPSRRPF